jgi:hypothetical protein
MSAYPFKTGEHAVSSGKTMLRTRWTYRGQRHVYDATLRYYLLGRDRMIAKLQLSLLEVGPRDEFEQEYAVLMIGAGSGKP